MVHAAGAMVSDNASECSVRDAPSELAPSMFHPMSTLVQADEARQEIGRPVPSSSIAGIEIFIVMSFEARRGSVMIGSVVVEGEW